MISAILLTHRWLGVVVGFLMTLWCLSGFVMMYSGYPALTPSEQLRGLAPLERPTAGAFARVALAVDAELSGARLEMMAGAPVLRIVQAGPSPQTFKLGDGQALAQVGAAEALAIGTAFGASYGIAGAPAAAIPTGIDQWTVQTFRRHQPLHRIDYPGGETAYISASGEVVQHTTRAERVLGWLGAVPHWLYPTLLRQDGALWTQVVIYSALAGCFLTATGLWMGVTRLRRRRDGRLGSPYRGLWWWHHMAGLFFGVLTLSWVASGLFTMNPWGFLDSEAGVVERERSAGPPMRWDALSAAFSRLPTLPAGIVRIEAAPLGGKLYLAAVGADGRQMRFDASGRPAPLSRADVAGALAAGPRLASLELMRGEDAYYYAHKTPAPLPVWRAILDDPARTRLYIDPVSGRLLRAIDAPARASRWLRNGMHSLDLPVLRTRPLWDLVVVPLLLLVTALCVTGTWLGYNRVKHDLRRMRRRRR